MLITRSLARKVNKICYAITKCFTDSLLRALSLINPSIAGLSEKKCEKKLSTPTIYGIQSSLQQEERGPHGKLSNVARMKLISHRYTVPLNVYFR